MKIKTILASIALLSAALTSCKQSNIATIEGELSGVKDNSIVEAFKIVDDMGVLIGQDTIIGGKFSLRVDSITELTKINIYIADGNSYSHPLYLEPSSEIKISGNPQEKLNIVSNVSEQKTADFFFEISNKFSQGMSTLQERYYKQEISVEDASRIQDSLMVVSVAENIDGLEQTSPSPEWLSQLENFCRSIRYMSDKGIWDDSWTERLKVQYNRLSEADKQTKYAKKANVLLTTLKPAVVGDMAPDGDLYDKDGNVHHLSDYKGKYVMLDFCSIGCGPCIMAFSYLKYLHQFDIENFVTISVAENGKKDCSELISKCNPTWPIYYTDDFGAFFAKYGVTAIPTFVLISPDGVILNNIMGFYSDAIIQTIKDNVGEYKKMSITSENNCKVIKMPTIKNAVTNLEVDEVRLYADSTVINFCTFSPFQIAKGSRIVCNGKNYKLIGADIKLGEYLNIELGNLKNFKLTFEALPKNAKTFDFIEDDADWGWKIFGIKVTE